MVLFLFDQVGRHTFGRSSKFKAEMVLEISGYVYIYSYI